MGVGDGSPTACKRRVRGSPLANNAHQITPSLGRLVQARVIDLSANEGLELKEETKREIEAQLGRSVEVRV